MKLRKIALGVIAALCLFTWAWAVRPVEAQSTRPEEALSARPEKSVYAVLRLEDVGGFLRWALSEENLKLVATVPDTELDEGAIQMITAALSKVPLKEAALLVSQTDPKAAPFLQVALSVPAGAELDRLAEGKGTAADLMALVLGTDSPLIPMLGGEAPFALTPKEGNVYMLDDDLAMAARDGLLLFSLSMDDLRAGLTALENEKGRLPLKRRFKTGNFAFLHMDPSVMEGISREQAAGNKDKGLDEEDIKAMREAFRAPFEAELGFERFAERFLLSMGFNLKEALSEQYLQHFKAWMDTSLVPGGRIALFGSGSPLFALGTYLNVEGFANNPSPEIKQLWKELMEGVKSLGISENEVRDLLVEGLSLVAGGRIPYEGFHVPGAYLALHGQAGAAASILDKLAKAGGDALAPVQVEGWEKVLRVDPSAAPVPCLLGVKDETLFFGLAEADTLAGKPSPSAKLEELMGKKSSGSLFMDFAGLQTYLKEEFAGLRPVLSMLGNPSMVGHIQGLLDAKLSVPSVSAWSPTEETVFFDFAIEDVPAGEGLLARLVKAVSAFAEAMDEAGKEGAKGKK